HRARDSERPRCGPRNAQAFCCRGSGQRPVARASGTRRPARRGGHVTLNAVESLRLFRVRKCEATFGKDHAQTRIESAMMVQPYLIALQRTWTYQGLAAAAVACGTK